MPAGCSSTTHVKESTSLWMAGLWELQPHQAQAWESLNTQGGAWPAEWSSTYSTVTGQDDPHGPDPSWAASSSYQSKKGTEIALGETGLQLWWTLNFVATNLVTCKSQTSWMNEYNIHISKMPSIAGIQSSWSSFSMRRIYKNSVLESWRCPWFKIVLEGLPLFLCVFILLSLHWLLAQIPLLRVKPAPGNFRLTLSS